MNQLRYIWYRISLSFEDFVVGRPELFIALVMVLVGAAHMIVG